MIFLSLYFLYLTLFTVYVHYKCMLLSVYFSYKHVISSISSYLIHDKVLYSVINEYIM